MIVDWIFGEFGPLVIQNNLFIDTHHPVLFNTMMGIYFGCEIAQLINQEDNGHVTDIYTDEPKQKTDW